MRLRDGIWHLETKTSLKKGEREVEARKGLILGRDSKGDFSFYLLGDLFPEIYFDLKKKDLYSCMFCGSEELSLLTVGKEDGVDRELHQVFCLGCAASGPAEVSIQKALESWGDEEVEEELTEEALLSLQEILEDLGELEED